MDPNQPFYQPPAQPQPQPQYSIDYLNQIAPQQQKNTPNKLLVIIGILVILLIVTVAVVGLSSLGGASTGTKLQTLAARLDNLQDVSEKAQPHVKNNQLRASNSSLTLYLANANRDIATPLSSGGVNIKKLDKTIVAKEKNAALTEALEDARLNAIYDRTYAREMNYQLSTTRLLMDDINESTKSQSLREFIATTKSNLEPIEKQMSDFVDSTN
jgi:hypothetical protein